MNTIYKKHPKENKLLYYQWKISTGLPIGRSVPSYKIYYVKKDDLPIHCHANFSTMSLSLSQTLCSVHVAGIWADGWATHQAQEISRFRIWGRSCTSRHESWRDETSQVFEHAERCDLVQAVLRAATAEHGDVVLRRWNQRKLSVVG